MNATRWVTLSEFVKHLGRTGVARVDETEKGWWIAWIDNSPQALAKQVHLVSSLSTHISSSQQQEASMKKERLTMSDEARERQLIAEQIEKAAAEKKEDETESPPPETERVLKREEGAEKVVLNISLAKPAVASTPASTSSTAGSVGLKMNPLKPGNAFKTANPLKRPNVFKMAAASSSSAKDDPSPSEPKKRNLTAAEALILEEQERKRRRMDRDNGA